MGGRQPSKTPDAGEAQNVQNGRWHGGEVVSDTPLPLLDLMILDETSRDNDGEVAAQPLQVYFDLSRPLGQLRYDASGIIGQGAEFRSGSTAGRGFRFSSHQLAHRG